MYLQLLFSLCLHFEISQLLLVLDDLLEYVAILYRLRLQELLFLQCLQSSFFSQLLVSLISLLGIPLNEKLCFSLFLLSRDPFCLLHGSLGSQSIDLGLSVLCLFLKFPQPCSFLLFLVSNSSILSNSKFLLLFGHDLSFLLSLLDVELDDLLFFIPFSLHSDVLLLHR